MTRTVLALAPGLFVIGLVAPVYGQVNMRNGNHYVGYTDIVAPDLSIERTYNSKGAGTGVMGYGWGSDFDTFLTLLGDGGLRLHRNGTGRVDVFEPAHPEPGALDAMIQAIVEARLASGWRASPEDVAEYRRELRNSGQRRGQDWERWARAGAVTATLPPAGTRWAASNQSGFLTVVRTEDGFLLEGGSEGLEFDDNGRLRWLKTDDGEYALVRDEDGRIVRIESAAGSVAHFVHEDEDDLVDRIRLVSAGGQVDSATYRYESSNLVEHMDAAGEVFHYAYDDAHNLTRIDYADGTARVIEYDPATEFTTRITEPDGTIRSYDYEGDALNYGTTLTVTTPDGRSRTNRYAWEVRRSATGREWTYRTVTEEGGVRTETTYNECCRRPVAIRRNGAETTFEYDARGNMTRKANAQEVLRNEYDLSVNKLARVERWTTDETRLIESFDFAYDAKAQLLRAEHSDGRWVELTYDDGGNIQAITLPDAHLGFGYNNLGKPTAIRVEGVGALTVTYDEHGEIESVDTDGSPGLALHITQAMQQLNELVRPAGVSFSM